MSGFMSVLPTRRIVHVKIININSGEYPFQVVLVEDDKVVAEDFEFFFVADPSLVKLYPTRESAVHGELERLHEEYSKERRKLRIQQQRYKWALRQVEDYKHFDELQNPIFTQ